jgi:RHS repeat-associated protein
VEAIGRRAAVRGTRGGLALFVQNPEPAAKEKTGMPVFSLAAEPLPLNNRNYRTNPIPQSDTPSQNSRLGLRLPTAALYQSLTLANSNTATGLHASLYDEGTRSRCTGKERDTETGLDYFGARYYGSAQGRFTSPDEPFADQHSEDPQTWNLYMYGRNNPLRYTDPDGRGLWDKIVGVAKSVGNAAIGLHNLAADGVNWALGTDFGHLHYFQSANADQDEGMRNANDMMMATPGLVPEASVSSTIRFSIVGADEEAAVPLITQNAAKGKAFQNALAADTALTDTNVVQNITVKTQSGVPTQIDVVSTNPTGNVVLQEAKSSATAPLTRNQAAAHPEIAKTGATVVGKGKPPYVGGTKIPPTQVQVVRPPQCSGGSGCPQ